MNHDDIWLEGNYTFEELMRMPVHVPVLIPVLMLVLMLVLMPVLMPVLMLVVTVHGLVALTLVSGRLLLTLIMSFVVIRCVEQLLLVDIRHRQLSPD